MKKKVIAVCGLTDSQVRGYLAPLIALDEIEVIYLVRRQPIDLPKVVSCSPPKWMRQVLFLAELYRLLSLFYLALTKSPALLYGIFFIPHGIYVSIIGWLFSIKVIQEIIGTDRPKVMRSRLLQRLLASADRIGVRGEISKAQLAAVGIPEEKMFTSIAVNAIDFDHFKPMDLPKKYDLIYCGRMDANKQLDVLIRAAALLKPQYQELRMVLVGDGPAKQSLQALSKKLEMQNAITFVGRQPNEAVPRYLNQSHIFVMTSAFEGLPVAMIEALSCGLPVVMPDVGDIGDVAEDGVNARLIRDVSVDGFVRNLLPLLEHPQEYEKLRQGALKSRKGFVEYYAMEQVEQFWQEILSESEDNNEPII